VISILERLKQETRALHEQIEAVVPILHPAADAAVYRRYLEKLLGFHRPVERDLAAVPGLEQLGLTLDRRWKSPRLERDLLGLGLAPGAVASLATCALTPRIHGLDSALGCMYVLEGATLGGQVVVRALSARLPAVLDRGSSYLRCYADETGAQWRAFTSVLLAHGRHEAAQAEMVAAARETFTTLHAWLVDDGRDAAREHHGARVAHG
jgi:heme oxygenase